MHDRQRRPCFLVMLPAGIGDLVLIGLSIIDQLIKNEPQAEGQIDVLCNSVQAELLRVDPRVRRVIVVSATFFATPVPRTWVGGVILSAEARTLLAVLRREGYAAVFPGSSTPVFSAQIQAPIIKTSGLELLRVFCALRRGGDLPLSLLTRRIINAHFAHRSQSLPDPGPDEAIPLYLSEDEIAWARDYLQALRLRAGAVSMDVPVLIVAPDTSSAVTRPPTWLLATALATVLLKIPHLIVHILPAYTAPVAAQGLYTQLVTLAGPRVELMDAEPQTSLLALAALIDQASIFVTGDTGLMHLAVAEKRLAPDVGRDMVPSNAVQVIALFGGSSPGLFGHSQRSVIVGRGRREQRLLVPGIFKEAYWRKRVDLFGHISAQDLADCMLQRLAASGGVSPAQP